MATKTAMMEPEVVFQRASHARKAWSLKNGSDEPISLSGKDAVVK